MKLNNFSLTNSFNIKKPASAIEGDMYYDDITNIVYTYVNNTWVRYKILGFRNKDRKDKIKKIYE